VDYFNSKKTTAENQGKKKKEVNEGSQKREDRRQRPSFYNRI